MFNQEPFRNSNFCSWPFNLLIIICYQHNFGKIIIWSNPIYKKNLKNAIWKYCTWQTLWLGGEGVQSFPQMCHVILLSELQIILIARTAFFFYFPLICRQTNIHSKTWYFFYKYCDFLGGKWMPLRCNYMLSLINTLARLAKVFDNKLYKTFHIKIK